MKKIICCFTGHREIEKGHEPYFDEVLTSILSKLIVYGVTDFRAGGALGFDTVAAESVLKMRNDNPDIKLFLCLPCPDQAAKWPYRDQALYRQILDKCNGYTYAEPRYTLGCMHKRNRQLVDGADFCVAYYDGKSGGGTAYTVKYAEAQGVPVINLYPLVREAKNFHENQSK